MIQERQYMKIIFYEENNIDKRLLSYVVMITKYHDQWVFCKHKKRMTWECPGGHIEQGETALEAGKRELYEETGAKEFIIEPMAVYSVEDENKKQYGMLFFVWVKAFGELPEMEMEKIELFKNLPPNWTYPLIQPVLLEFAENWLLGRNIHGN